MTDSSRVDRLRALWSKLRDRRRRDGFAATAKSLVRVSVEWYRGQFARAGGDEFDREFGTDTGGVIPLWRLRIGSRYRNQGARYQASPPQIVRELIERIPIQHDEFVYVDLGSGKGRTLLVASEYPFKRIIGVEFSPELHAVAEENIRRYQSDRRRCSDLTSICADASNFELPAENLVLFLYNPFGEEVLSHVLMNLERSLAGNERGIYVLYWNPVQRQLLDSCPFLRQVEQTDAFVVYSHTANGTTS